MFYTDQAARQMAPQLAQRGAPVPGSELFAQPWEPLFDMAAHAGPQAPLEVVLWSGLRLLALPQLAGRPAPSRAPLREVEIALIRKAVAEAKGNVMQAAQALGISRATVYRKLAAKASVARKPQR